MTSTNDKNPDTGIDLDLASTYPDKERCTPASTNAQLSMDRNVDGKQHGHLTLVVTTQALAPYQLQIPFCQIKGTRPGPDITFLAGLHGDEPEGTLVLHRLARELNEDNISGCLTLLPAINPVGLELAQRFHEPDGLNLDKAFPGSHTGSYSEQLAAALVQYFIDSSDLIVDLRSGGQALQFIPSTAVQFTSDRAARERNEAAMIAFGAPNSLRLPASAPYADLQGTLSAMGKDYIQAELGGGGSYGRQPLEMAHSGCLNVMRHKGMLDDELELAATRLLEVRNDTYYLYAGASGLLEPLVFAGEAVWHDEPVAYIVNHYDTSAPVHSVMPQRNATLVAIHPGGFVRQGQLLAILAEEVHG